jgi:hypothetical protein
MIRLLIPLSEFPRDILIYVTRTDRHRQGSLQWNHIDGYLSSHNVLKTQS